MCGWFLAIRSFKGYCVQWTFAPRVQTDMGNSEVKWENRFIWQKLRTKSWQQNSHGNNQIREDTKEQGMTGCRKKGPQTRDKQSETYFNGTLMIDSDKHLRRDKEDQVKMGGAGTDYMKGKTLRNLKTQVKQTQTKLTSMIRRRQKHLKTRRSWQGLPSILSDLIA